MQPSPPSLLARCGAEALGTFILVFFGCGAVHVAVLTEELAGLGQVALVWAVAIMLATFAVGSISGAHINPAMTVAFAFWNRFAWRDVPAYLAAQLAGALLAAATLFTLFSPFLERKEHEKNVVRGAPGSEITAMCYGEYYHVIGEPAACLAEFLGTLLLAFMVFALIDDRNQAAPAARLAPVFIGLTVGVLICVIAPLTQAGFNPARDFGPRLFAWAAGWGEIALPGPNGRGCITVYLLAPVVGAIAGGGLYTQLVQPCFPPHSQDGKLS